MDSIAPHATGALCHRVQRKNSFIVFYMLGGAGAVSPSRLIRLFKRKLGTTPHDRLMRHRIAR